MRALLFAVLVSGCVGLPMQVRADNVPNHSVSFELMQRIATHLKNKQFGDCQLLERMNHNGLKLRFIHDNITYVVIWYPLRPTYGPAFMIDRWTSPEFVYYDVEPDGQLDEAGPLHLHSPPLSRLSVRRQQECRQEYDAILRVFEQHLKAQPK